MSTVFLNGAFAPLHDAKISVLDRGFMFGDGVYEVLPVYDGYLLGLQRHLLRLARSLAAIAIDSPMSDAEWGDMLSRLVATNGGGDQSVYIQVTRGAASRDHIPAAGISPTVFAMSSPYEFAKPRPSAAITLPDFRWQRCDIKATSLLPNVLLRMQAQSAGATEALLIRDGHLTEGATSTVFVVDEGTIKTPPLSTDLLPGVTRDLIVELLRENERSCELVAISEQVLHKADEIWLSSSHRELTPITELDGSLVGEGNPGPVWEATYALYEDYKQRMLANRETNN